VNTVTDPATRNAAVHVLLEKASNAHDGADLAREMMDGPNAKLLDDKARALLQDAQAVDPTHEAAAWGIFSDFMREMEAN
jgi:hypothetical protein